MSTYFDHLPIELLSEIFIYLPVISKSKDELGLEDLFSNGYMKKLLGSNTFWINKMIFDGIGDMVPFFDLSYDDKFEEYRFLKGKSDEPFSNYFLSRDSIYLQIFINKNINIIKWIGDLPKGNPQDFLDKFKDDVMEESDVDSISLIIKNVSGKFMYSMIDEGEIATNDVKNLLLKLKLIDMSLYLLGNVKRLYHYDHEYDQNELYIDRKYTNINDDYMNYYSNEHLY